MSNKQLIAEINEEAIVWDGFDDAIIGYTMNSDVAVYDVDKMVEILVNNDDMTQEDAWDYLGYNVFSTGVGDYTPVHIKLFE